jgi:hypothetical protein
MFRHFLSETPQVILKALINNFGLPIYLMVVASAHLERGAL